ncbi:MAG: hypothetical protein AB2L24_00730 [Mangrovibacterium sp.]
MEEELYNIQEDPYCMNNLAGESSLASIQVKLKTEMEQELTRQADPRILGNGDIFDRYPYQGIVRDYYNRFMAGEKVSADWISPTDYDPDMERFD